MKFKRKIEIIEAVQYRGSSTQRAELKAWVQGGEMPDPDAIHTRDYGAFKITTCLGKQKCNPGDYVVDDGRFTVVSKDYFEARYEEIGFAESLVSTPENIPLNTESTMPETKKGWFSKG